MNNARRDYYSNPPELFELQRRGQTREQADHHIAKARMKRALKAKNRLYHARNDEIQRSQPK